MARPNAWTFSEDFSKRLDQGVFWEGYISAVCAREGLWVIHNPSTNPATDAERKASILNSSGDMIVCPRKPIKYKSGEPIYIDTFLRHEIDRIDNVDPGSVSMVNGFIINQLPGERPVGFHVECKSSSSGSWGRSSEYPFLCARRAFQNKFGSLNYLPRPFLVVGKSGKIQAILPGTEIAFAKNVDRRRGYEYEAVFVARADVVPFSGFLTWAREKAAQWQ